MSVRTEVAAFLTERLPDYKVIPYGRVLDGVEDLAVMVEVTRYERQAQFWNATVTVWVVTGHQDPERAESALDDALLETLGALNDFPSVDVSAERVVIQDSFNAYQITLNVNVTFEQDEEDQ